jgi:hypothetical protein
LKLVSTNLFSILEPQWHFGGPLAFRQQAADEVGATCSAGRAKKGWGWVWEVLGDRGGYGSGCVTSAE